MTEHCLKITALGSLGEGIGKLDNGLKVFIEGALPSETIEARLTVCKKNYAKADLLKVLKPSKDRVQPICPLFGTCGGCHLMHLSYPAQLEAKRKKVADAIERVGKRQAPVEACVPSSQPLGYRNKIQIPVTSSAIGLYKKQSHDIVDVPTCYIHNQSGDVLYQWIREHLPHRESVHHLLIRTAIFNKQTLVVIVTDRPGLFNEFAKKLMATHPDVVGVVENIQPHKTNTILGPTFITVCGQPYVIETLKGLKFKIGAASFFQVNPWQAENLVDTVMRLAAIEPHETFYDAFTGVGLFALFAAKHTRHVKGTECIAQAIDCAKENAALNGLDYCQFEVAQASAKKADITLINPPRKGCDSRLLGNLKSKKVIYVSCDPATLARDLSLLTDYHIEKVIPLDLFPQTVHVETVVLLKRKKHLS
jgi:23S rRNA (uracil1939-C5)-methyltransferase